MLLSRELLLWMNRERWQLQADWYRSPLQAGLHGDPWRVIVASIVIEQSNPEIARDFVQRFFKQYPHPVDVQGAMVRTLEDWFPNTVTQSRKENIAHWIITNSIYFRGTRWNNLSEWATSYTQDAVSIFCCGHYDFAPRDPLLYRHARAMREVYLGSEVEKPVDAPIKKMNTWEKIESLNDDNRKRLEQWLRNPD
jgi:hypothetical protein